MPPNGAFRRDRAGVRYATLSGQAKPQGAGLLVMSAGERRRMPRLSIVLVTHREQGFLRRCLASVLDQGSADLEVVAVDDAAPDHSAQILAEIAAADPRVRVHRLPERHGAGPARQAGLSMSTGEYVWFVDATDLLPDGALSAVLAALEESSPQ